MLSKLEGQSLWAMVLKEVAQRAGIETEDKRERSVLILSIGIPEHDVD